MVLVPQHVSPSQINFTNLKPHLGKKSPLISIVGCVVFWLDDCCFACHYMFIYLRSIFADIKNHLGEKPTNVDRWLCGILA